jgi:hypothetical protein
MAQDTCEVDFWGFIHYNVQYALFIMIYIILKITI